MKVIAESAFNHNGDINYLKELALASKAAGCDYFTVQMMDVESFCTKDYTKYQLYKENEITSEEWRELFLFCEEEGITVLPCVLEEKSFKLATEFNFELIKIHATDINNVPLLKEIANTNGVNVILETQCATSIELEIAINILGDKIEALFSGYSNYPSEVEELNLNVLDTFKSKYPYKIGFADHTLDVANVPLMLLAKNCDYIEKHITLTRNNRNFDWQVSLYPEEMTIMVQNIHHYSRALGGGIKHPSSHEKSFRSIMYKKVIPNSENLKRSDSGEFYIENLINSFEQNKTVAAVIARLKSQRLKEKVLLPFIENELIIDLFNSISRSNKYEVILATSNLKEDDKLISLFEKHKLTSYRGDAVSVIDRLLQLALNEKASSIFRVTGDNPFTDYKLMELMIEQMNEHNLDYVKVNGVPFGIGCELFSTKYLWKLYLDLKTTKYSEYLTWYVLLDEKLKIGSIDVKNNKDFKLVNLSVDLQEDYNRCINVITKTKFKNTNDINLKSILDNLSTFDQVDDSKYIKLPEGSEIRLSTYLNDFENKDYAVRWVYDMNSEIVRKNGKGVK